MNQPTVAPTWRSAVREQRAVLAVCLLLQALLGALVGRAYLAGNNTLLANGRWISTKTTVERGLLGAYSFLTEPQALAGGRLHLGAWHGFNEVIYHRPVVAPVTLELEFELAPGGYLVAIVNRGEDGASSAVRFSSRPAMPSLFAVVDPDGAFVSRRPLAGGRVTPGTRHRARIEQTLDAVKVSLDGVDLGSFPQRTLRSQSIGFRGGRRDAMVDDIAVRDAGGDVVRERFDLAARLRWVAAAGAGAMLAAGFGLFLLLQRRHPGGGSQLAIAYVMTTVGVLAVGAVLLTFVVQRVRWYPGLTAALREKEEYFKQGETSRVVGELEARLRELPPAGTYRILFVGSSQTWGAGASRHADAFVPRLERALDAAAGSPDAVTCLNGAVSSTRARDHVALIQRHWLQTDPALVVINLGSNDKGSGREFLPTMRSLLALARSGGARVVLVKEANAREAAHPALAARHRDLDTLAAELDVTVIDLHGYLARRADSGFLWWDHVHLTSYGHRLAARKLFAELAPLVLPHTGAGALPAGDPETASEPESDLGSEGG